MTLKRAYSTLEIKATEGADGKRRFTGIASSVTPDRMQDVVEPRGMKVKLPAPLLWQHDAHEPIGWVTATRVSDKEIEVDCEVANIQEPGALKDRLDMVWSTLTAKLVRGLSIGFNALESARIEGTYSYHYLTWELLELSCVTVPAHASATILEIKSADQAARRAAFGTQAGSRVVRLDPPAVKAPGVSGITQPRRKGVVYL